MKINAKFKQVKLVVSNQPIPDWELIKLKRKQLINIKKKKKENSFKYFICIICIICIVCSFILSMNYIVFNYSSLGLFILILFLLNFNLNIFDVTSLSSKSKIIAE